MDVSDSGPTESAQPPKKVAKIELLPDIAVDSFVHPVMQNCIAQNNAETRPKKRGTLFDVINECLVSVAQGKRSDLGDSSPVDVVFRILNEARERHKMLPRSSTVARILYLWSSETQSMSGHTNAYRLIRWLLDSEPISPAMFRTTMDEKVASVAMRCVAKIADAVERRDVMTKLLATVPPELVRRRLFSPMFELAAESGDSTLMEEALTMTRSAQLELWDADFNMALRSLIPCGAGSPNNAVAGHPVAAADEWPVVSQRRLRAVLNTMLDHHPVLGSDNAHLLQSMLRGVPSCVDPAVGTCSACGEVLQKFDYTEDDRKQVEEEIMEKLVRPRIAMKSHYEPNVQVSAEVQGVRETELAAFLGELHRIPYDTVIDGANVGYYGLSSWYPRAKAALLASRGVNVAVIPRRELETIPFPVDVPPQHETIDQMIRAAEAAGHRPLVVIHQRHFANAAASSTGVPCATQPQQPHRLIQQWKDRDQVVASPSFLNDDYCWLLACVSKARCSVITNDLMRDHHFGLLSQRNFLRWRAAYRMTYKAFVDKASGAVHLSLHRAPKYSVWIQQSRQSLRWHIPFLAARVLDQATNRIRSAEQQIVAPLDDLDKDGGDTCDGWICTAPFSGLV